MDKKEAVAMIETNETVLRANMMNPPQLTPTGKISHAKTRVYTQRYRKAWEQMPDFKGWLTGVPHQPTRAFCTYCRKNLHAHRLSLLKHTCTMKHQRCALMHQNEVNEKEAAAEQKIAEIEAELDDEPEEGEGEQQLDDEGDDGDDDEEIEYIVERLDEDDEVGDTAVKIEPDLDDDEEEEEEVEEDEEDDDEPMAKIPKKENSCRDALAEAMAHVHGEYLDDNGDPVNVELEMVVDSVEPNAQEMQPESELPDAANEENKTNIEAGRRESNGSQNADENEYKERKTASSASKSYAGGQSSESTSETEMVVARKPRLTQAFHASIPKTLSSHLRSQPPSNSPITVSSPVQSKTITLTSGGKTVTLTASSAGKYTAGSTQYVLSKNKGKLPTLFLADSSPAMVGMVSGSDQSESSPKAGQIKSTQQLVEGANSFPVASTSSASPQFPKKGVKPPPTKKPCISTHVLDTSKGLPVGGLQVSLYKLMDGRWTFQNESTTTPDGRCADLVDSVKCSFTAGRYKIHYDVDKYFTLRRIETMYPFIEIVFDVKNPTEHYHIPVLLSPFGYTTYRGT